MYFIRHDWIFEERIMRSYNRPTIRILFRKIHDAQYEFRVRNLFC